MNAKIYAKQQGVDLNSLFEILSYWRAHGTESEQYFVNKSIATIKGIKKDAFGNYYLRIGKAPIMWSCHTDTVHNYTKEGVIRQNIQWDLEGNIVSLHKPKPGQCLGADDGAGIWLLLEMIKARRPGLYIFHRGEEKGRLGSRWIAENNKESLEGLQFAVAFDRRATTSIITKQRGSTCCSEEFSKSMAEQLEMGFKSDPTGSYTDTASYTEIIPECTNISCGYYNEHGIRETLDVMHLLNIREKLLKLDVKALVVSRDPTKKEVFRSYSSGYQFPSYYNHNPYGQQRDPVPDDKDLADAGRASAWDRSLEENEAEIKRVYDLVKRYPNLVAEWLVMEEDIDAKMLKSGIFEETSATLVECPWCINEVDVDDVIDDQQCPSCWNDLGPTLVEKGHIPPSQLVQRYG